MKPGEKQRRARSLSMRDASTSVTVVDPLGEPGCGEPAGDLGAFRGDPEQQGSRRALTPARATTLAYSRGLEALVIVLFQRMMNASLCLWCPLVLAVSGNMGDHGGTDHHSARGRGIGGR